MLNGIAALPATLGALVATGLLVKRAYNERLLFLIAWSLTLVGVSIALAGMTAGFVAGFNGVLFRAMEIGGALIAPIWLAIGMIELTARHVQVRFAAWLFAVSFSVVAVVILLLDPLTGSFAKALPNPGKTYDSLPLLLVDLAHGVTVVALVACPAVTAVRASRKDREAFELQTPVAVVALAGVLVVAGSRGLLPAVVAVLALGGAAGLVWFGATRALPGYDDEEYAGDEPYESFAEGDGRTGYDSDYGRAPQPVPPVGEQMNQPPPNLPPQRSVPLPPEVPAAAPIPPASDPFAGPPPVPPASDPFAGPPPGRPPGQVGRDEMSGGLPPGVRFPGTGAQSFPGTGAQSFPGTGAQNMPVPPAPVPNPAQSAHWGQIIVYTLVEGRGEVFDRLAQDVVRAAQRAEPDTLIFACHEVAGAPTQRIFYQLFRDQTAFEGHERQPHVQQFLAESRPHVVATNVIDLRLNAAKVIALPSLAAQDYP